MTDGPFTNLSVAWVGTIVVEHCLSRAFLQGIELEEWTDQWKEDAMNNISSATSFETFRQQIEDKPHLALPHILHGDFSVGTAPIGKRTVSCTGWLVLTLTEDPVFFLHHSNIDRLWWEWQQKDLWHRLTEYAGPRSASSADDSASLDDLLELGDLGPSVQVRDIMNTMEGDLCYVYQ